MKKVLKSFLMRDRYTDEFYRCGVLLIASVLAFIFSDELFGYFVWQDMIRSGQFLFHFYIICTGIIFLFGKGMYRNKGFVCILLAGITPAAAVLLVRWYYAGFQIARILILILEGYPLLLAAQIPLLKEKRWGIIKMFLKVIHRTLAALAFFSLFGAAGYIATGNAASSIPEPTETISVSQTDGRAWNGNRDILRKWKENTYVSLNEEEKKALFQATIDLESYYWGIDAPTVELEDYEAGDQKSGYYSCQYNVISVKSDLLYAPREEILNTLLHECNHAYNEAVAASVNWNDKDIDRNLRMYKDAYSFKEASENYVMPEDDFASYYDNPLEIAAREYAEEWTEKYLEYIDSI